MKKFKKFIRYNFWYLKKPPWESGITPKELVAFTNHHPPGRAVDLGCGSGTNLVHLARCGWQVVGIDFAWLAVTYASRKLKKANLPGKVFCRSVLDIPPDSEKFDLILDIGCYHGLSPDDREKYQKQIIERCVEGGYFLLYANLQGWREGFGVQMEEFRNLDEFFSRENEEFSNDPWGRKAVWLTFRRKKQLNE
ncbi:MAG TPA: class I SAM-dependent methyltransferase [Anaerolineaceae bacterium]